ncbi:MAG: methyltransferase domain-containing protein [Planctomycetales bacterium]|nr:methyltransferase domain-containing protein [Planctomycetales bacterium]NIM09335.1 methyltransferase domain-containing protein [Planctomycetales bacterium]NIN08802.1 methyltransferase domain-containing protein [Planctomycetales bacterium]NIN77919.1 methyltransferase domain-containing protein [Planctomycetales bacterium]NIO35102.1 methyltransferase domain-containing protein [Planctomycetales bacterium]
MALRRLNHLQRGRLVISDPWGLYELGSLDTAGMHAELVVHDTRFYGCLVFGGVLGAVEAYRSGYWDSPNLTSLVRLFGRNLHLARNLNTALAVPRRLIDRFAHFLRRNSRSGSRQNIAAHYDLGNEFFALFLDETLSYSSGVFAGGTDSLAEASRHKNELICRKLELAAGDHVLEIGSGWGGFALQAAQEYGCRVTTTTISREQYAVVCQRVRQAGLEDQVTVVLSDYRDLQGRYDKLVSVEMIEAVGHEYLPQFFRVCSRHLKPDGMMLLQAITISDDRYDQYRCGVDFIQRYIFPGGCLPSLGRIRAALDSVGDLNIGHSEEFGQHYARTLCHWRRRFLAARQRLVELGFDEPFVRMWEFYFCYCEGGFRENLIDVSQIVLTKPLCKTPPGVVAWTGKPGGPSGRPDRPGRRRRRGKGPYRAC